MSPHQVELHRQSLAMMGLMGSTAISICSRRRAVTGGRPGSLFPSMNLIYLR